MFSFQGDKTICDLNAAMSYNYLFKIVVVGDHNCGKSCILLRFAENAFRTDHISTLGVDFKLKTIKLGRDKIRLELWDTAGMERYRFVRKNIAIYV